MAQWKVLASTFSVTEKTDGKKFANALRKIGETDNAALVEQIIGLQKELSDTEAVIDHAETEMNAEVNALYGLNDPEIRLIERG